MPRLLPLLAAALLGAALPTHAQDKGSPAALFACPMKCEGPRAYPAEGKCPECGMKLRVLPAAPAATIAPARITPAGPLSPGREVSLRATADAPLPERATIAILRHGHDWSALIDATRAPDGSISFAAVFPTEGLYTLLIEPAPATPGAVCHATTLSVGEARPLSPMLDPSGGRPQRLGPYLAVLSTVQTPVAGRPVELRFGVAQSGLPVSDFEPLSAGPGHCLLISEDAAALAPAHPVDPASLPRPEDCDMPGMDMTPEPGTPPQPALVFRAVPPKPGLYRAWFRFRHCGQVHAVPFVLNVHPPQGTETPR